MKRNPMVRALCERARRPGTRQILAGLVLMAPAGLMTMRTIDPTPKTALPVVLAPIEVVAPSKHAVVASLAEEYKISSTLAADIYEAAAEHKIDTCFVETF